MKARVGNSETGSFRKEFIPRIQHHVGEVRKGGWSVLLRKARAFLGMALLMLMRLVLLPLLPMILIEWALRPWMLIRFGPLISRHIGGFAGNTEMYLCRRDAGMDEQRAFDVFYHRGRPSNQQLQKMWERILHVSPLARPMHFLNRNLPGGRSHIIPWPYYGERDVHGLLPRTPVHLSFTPEEERLGQEALRALGIPEGAPFICFHARDSGYYQRATPKEYFRRADFRDSTVHNHVPAAEEMTRRGYFAVRMGAFVKEALTTTNPKVIDYAARSRGDFMDIYLCAKCYFYIGDQTGLQLVPSIFRKPMACVNGIPLEHVPTWSPYNLFIPKKLWVRQEKRFFTFHELFDMQPDGIRLSDLRRTEEYEQLGIEPVENTPQEIMALAVEMDERLKGTWPTTEEDERLQKCFWSLFKASEENHGIIFARIGAEFLRQNQELLD